MTCGDEKGGIHLYKLPVWLDKIRDVKENEKPPMFAPIGKNRKPFVAQTLKCRNFEMAKDRGKICQPRGRSTHRQGGYFPPQGIHRRRHQQQHC